MQTINYYLQPERYRINKFVGLVRLNDVDALRKHKVTYGSIDFSNCTPASKFEVHNVVLRVTDRNMLLALITNGYDVNLSSGDNFKSSLFYKALEKEDIELITLCLQNGGDIHNIGAEGVITIFLQTGNSEIVEQCLKGEQDAEKLLSFVKKILLDTIELYAQKSILETWSAHDNKKYMEIIKLSTAHGANMNCTYCDRNNKQSTPLIGACIKSNIDLVRFLINCGADINYVTMETGPLHAAINSGSVKIVEYLLDQPNIDVNQQTSTALESPLHVASRKGNVRFIEMLLDKGANKSAYNLEGEYPYNVMAKKSADYIYKILALDSLTPAEEISLILEVKKLKESILQIQNKYDEILEKLQKNDNKLGVLEVELQQVSAPSRKKQT